MSTRIMLYSIKAIFVLSLTEKAVSLPYRRGLETGFLLDLSQGSLASVYFILFYFLKVAVLGYFVARNARFCFYCLPCLF